MGDYFFMILQSTKHVKKMWICAFITCYLCGCIYFVDSQNIMSNSVHDDLVINKVVDELLKYVRMAIKDEGMDRIVIPDLSTEFDGPLHVKAKFNARNGTAGFLSTIHRTGDAKINYHKQIATLTLDLGLRELVVDYDNYTAEILDLGPTGKMQATINQNSIFASFYFLYTFRHCKEDLGVLVMDKFDHVNVNLTGLYPFDWLLNDLAAWIADDFRNDIKYLIEDTIRKAIKSAMTKYSICNYLPHLVPIPLA